MNKKKYAVLAVLIALWVTAFVFLESFIGGLIGLEEVEFWPALMGPSLIGLLGGEAKKAEKKFYVTASAGVVAALIFVLLEHALVPVIGGTPGVLTALFLAVFLLIAGQFFLPPVSGPISFVYFNAATIMTHDILTLSITRLVVLLLGTFIFQKVEHLLVKAIAGKKHS